MSASHPFTTRLIAWQKAHGRHDLPWQQSRDAYRVWLSEIMLQQTQVTTVIPYYQRFLARFPDVATLAAAPQEAVIALWAGLGYYARARNLHRCAQVVLAQYGGVFPQHPAQLADLPGIGRSTAAAIAAFAYGRRAAILDGNVKRVLCRQFGIEGFPGSAAVDRKLWELAETLLPATDIEAYTQGLMDLGATCCTRSKPACARCPLTADCVARRDGRQGELPTPKPRATIPERSANFVFFLAGDQVLLERRPASGLWGGLLVAPEGEVVDLAAQRGLAPGEITLLPAFQHVFTHFRLNITAQYCRVKAPAQVNEGHREWLPLAKAADAGVPTPMARLLRTILADSR